MYGIKRPDGEYKFYPYIEKYVSPQFHKIAKNIKTKTKPDNVMVLGCARGYLVKAFRDIGIECYGVDISEWAIENCHPDVVDYLYCGDICDLSMWDDKSFDFVFANDVLEHIRVPDLYLALDETCRIGTIVRLGIPIGLDDRYPDQSEQEESHVSVYTHYWWISQFEARGFVLMSYKLFNEDRNGNFVFVDKYTEGKYRLR